MKNSQAKTTAKHSTGTSDAITMLTKDHKEVKALFDKFESTKSEQAKKNIVETVCDELEVHAQLEEEIFYPALRAKINDDDLMNEAEEEHLIVKRLIAELREMQPSDEHYDAKFTVLGEGVEHHVKEEESDMFVKAKKSGVDLAELGAKMLKRRQQLNGNVGDSAHSKTDRKHPMGR